MSSAAKNAHTHSIKSLVSGQKTRLLDIQFSKKRQERKKEEKGGGSGDNAGVTVE